MSGNRHQIKAPVSFLGARNSSNPVSNKSCSYAGLLGEALSISGPGHVLSFPDDAWQWCVSRAASQMWLEPLGSELLVNTLTFAACKTPWTMQSKSDAVCRSFTVTLASSQKLSSVLLSSESIDNKQSVVLYERKCCGLRCLHFIISFMDVRNVNS